MFRTGFLSIIRSLALVHTAIHTGYADCLLAWPKFRQKIVTYEVHAESVRTAAICFTRTLYL